MVNQNFVKEQEGRLALLRDTLDALGNVQECDCREVMEDEPLNQIFDTVCKLQMLACEEITATKETLAELDRITELTNIVNGWVKLSKIDVDLSTTFQ